MCHRRLKSLAGSAGVGSRRTPRRETTGPLLPGASVAGCRAGFTDRRAGTRLRIGPCTGRGVGCGDAASCAPPPRRPRLVRGRVRRPHRLSGEGVARGPGRRPHPHRRPHRLRQDPRGVSRGHRRARRGSPAGEARRRGPGRLRVAAQGALLRHRAQSRGAPSRDRGVGRPARHTAGRDPGDGAHGRHPPGGPPGDDPPAPPHPRHHAGIASHPADQRVGAQCARPHAHRHRRRDPCRRRQQARRAPRADPGAARSALRGGSRRLAARGRSAPPAPDRTLRHPAPDGARRALPRREPGGALRDRRRRLPPPPRPRHRAAVVAARAGDGDRSVGRGLRPHRRTRPRAPHDPRLHQHPAPRGASRPRPRGAARREGGGLPPRKPRARTPIRGGAAPQGWNPHPPRRHRLARARHRHRRRRPRMPARHHPEHRDLPAAGRPLRARDRRDPEGPALPLEPGRPRGVRSALRRGPPGRARHPHPVRPAARRARAADRGRGGGERMGDGGRCSPSSGARGPTAPSTRGRSSR